MNVNGRVREEGIGEIMCLLIEALLALGLGCKFEVIHVIGCSALVVNNSFYVQEFGKC